MEPFITEQINKQDRPDDNSKGSLKYINLEPGDCSRYQLLYGTYECPYYGKRYSLTHLGRGTGGRTFVWNDGMNIDLGYFMEKTGICNQTTACVLLRFIERKGHQIEQYGTILNYNEMGIWVGRGRME